MSRETEPSPEATSRQVEVQYLLRQAVVVDGPSLASSHVWISERERWKELVFALLTALTSRPHSEVRAVVDQMDDAGLLDVDMLGQVGEERRRGVAPGAHARSVLDFLREGGFAEEEIASGLDAMCDAALSLQQRFDGKVQRYLRRYGELMLDEIEDLFQFTTLDADAARSAFTYWLQNVLNMPLPLLDEPVRTASRHLGVEPDELVLAADELDLNLAFLDDVLLSYDARRAVARPPQEPADG
jgi:hypothetical protein